jgi:hypothetical protein
MTFSEWEAAMDDARAFIDAEAGPRRQALAPEEQQHFACEESRRACLDEAKAKFAETWRAWLALKLDHSQAS